MKIIKMFYDLETTGLRAGVAGLHQISGCIEVNGKVVQEFNLKVKPFEGAKIDAKALLTCNVTEEQIMAYTRTDAQAYKAMVRMLSKYVNKFDRTEKIFLCGYNNATFDDSHLMALWERQDDPYLYSWFWADALDARILAAQYLQERRASMPNFRLKTVAKELGIDVDESKLHDAKYDIYLTREVYRIVTGLEIEL